MNKIEMFSGPACKRNHPALPSGLADHGSHSAQQPTTKINQTNATYKRQTTNNINQQPTAGFSPPVHAVCTLNRAADRASFLRAICRNLSGRDLTISGSSLNGQHFSTLQHTAACCPKFQLINSLHKRHYLFRTFLGPGLTGRKGHTHVEKRKPKPATITILLRRRFHVRQWPSPRIF